METLIILILLILILSLFSFLLGLSIGKRIGAKNGIDYCFARYNDAAKQMLLKDLKDKEGEEWLHLIKYLQFLML